MFDLRQRKNGRPLLVGHRGAMEVAPENTFPALEAGLAGGADILEIDVQLTADGQVILFHDTTLTAKTGIEGMIKDYTADFLRTLDVGRYFDESFAGTHMPLLSEVLAWAKGRVALMIELKHGPVFEPRLDYTTIDLIEQFGMEDEVVLTSFDQFALRRVKERNPQLTTSFIYIGRFLHTLDIVKGLPLDALSPATDFLTPEDVAQIHAAGYACSPGGFWWDYPTLIEWGVDTISSNNPAAVSI
ncbi:MAG: glycerophosphodiester phosphodiesterase [Chloroflexi bacterium]|nr:MAG: glycerophosphodiester phosphodiesterase [Chloroflexota bacterium]